LESCSGCSFEFRELKTTFSMLDSVEMEDAPENLEYKVISRIEEAREAGHRVKKMLGISSVILAAWVGLCCLILFTPFLDTILGCMDSFFKMIDYAFISVGNILYSVLIFFARIMVVGRALDSALKSTLDMYGMIIAAMVMLMAIILRLYGYMFKSVRR
jgi:hypothetical protein